MTTIDFRTAVREALDEELAADDRVIFFGEDVAIAGGVFAVTPGLYEKYGRERVFDTPISELALAGAAFGAAISGLRPVIEIMFGDFLTLAMDSVVNQSTKYWYLTGEQVPVPLVIRSIVGGGGRFGAIHSQVPVSWFMGVPGLKIVGPATPDDAKGLLRSAIRDDNPVLFFEHKRLYGVAGDVGEDLVPIGVARVAREGTDVTVVSAMNGVHEALEGRRDPVRGWDRGRSHRPQDASSTRHLDDPHVRGEDEPHRCRRGGAAHRRVGRRGHRAGDGGGTRRSRRRLAHRDGRKPRALLAPPRGRVPPECRTDRVRGAESDAVNMRRGGTAPVKRC